jgi:hypothetical protein
MAQKVCILSKYVCAKVYFSYFREPLRAMRNFLIYIHQISFWGGQQFRKFAPLQKYCLGVYQFAPLPQGGTLVPFYFPGGALPFKTILLVIYDTSSIREPPKVKT